MRDEINNVNQFIQQNQFIENISAVYNCVFNQKLLLGYIFDGINRQQESMCIEQVIFDVQRKIDKNNYGTKHMHAIVQLDQYLGGVNQKYDLGNSNQMLKKMSVITQYIEAEHITREHRRFDTDLHLNSLFNFNNNGDAMLKAWIRYLKSILNIGSQKDKTYKIKDWILNQTSDEYYNGQDEISLQLRYKLTNNRKAAKPFVRDLLVSYYMKAGRIFRLTSHGIIQIVRCFQILIDCIPQDQFNRDVKDDGAIALYAIQMLNVMRDKLTRANDVINTHKLNILNAVQTQFTRQKTISMEPQRSANEQQKLNNDLNAFIYKPMLVIRQQLWNFNMFQQKMQYNKYSNLEGLIEQMVINMESDIPEYQQESNVLNNLLNLRNGISDIAIHNQNRRVKEGQDQIVQRMHELYGEMIEQYALKETIRQAMQQVKQDTINLRQPRESKEFQPLFIDLKIVVKIVKWNKAVMNLSRLLNDDSLTKQQQKVVARNFMNQIFQHGYILNDELNNYYTIHLVKVFDWNIIVQQDGVDYATNILHQQFFEDFFGKIEDYADEADRLNEHQNESTGIALNQRYDYDNVSDREYRDYLRKLHITSYGNSKYNGFQFQHTGMSPFDVINARATSLSVMFRIMDEDQDQIQQEQFSLIAFDDYQRWSTLQNDQHIMNDLEEDDQPPQQQQEQQQELEEEEEEEENPNVALNADQTQQLIEALQEEQQILEDNLNKNVDIIQRTIQTEAINIIIETAEQCQIDGSAEADIQNKYYEAQETICRDASQQIKELIKESYNEQVPSEALPIIDKQQLFSIVKAATDKLEVQKMNEIKEKYQNEIRNKSRSTALNKKRLELKLEQDQLELAKQKERVERELKEAYEKNQRLLKEQEETRARLEAIEASNKIIKDQETAQRRNNLRGQMRNTLINIDSELRRLLNIARGRSHLNILKSQSKAIQRPKKKQREDNFIDIRNQNYVVAVNRNIKLKKQEEQMIKEKKIRLDKKKEEKEQKFWQKLREDEEKKQEEEKKKQEEEKQRLIEEQQKQKLIDDERAAEVREERKVHLQQKKSFFDESKQKFGATPLDLQNTFAEARRVSLRQQQIRKNQRKKIPSPNEHRVLFNICQFYQASHFTQSDRNSEQCFETTQRTLAHRIVRFIHEVQNIPADLAQQLIDRYIEIMNQNGPAIDFNQLFAQIIKRKKFMAEAKSQRIGLCIRVFTIDKYQIQQQTYTDDEFDDCECQAIDIIDMKFHIFVANKPVIKQVLAKLLEAAPAIQLLCSEVGNYHTYLKESQKEDSNMSILEYTCRALKHMKLKILKYNYIMKSTPKESSQQQCSSCALFIISYDLETYQLAEDQLNSIQLGGTPHWDYCCSFVIRAVNRTGGFIDSDDEKAQYIKDIVSKYNSQSPITMLYSNTNNKTASQVFIEMILKFSKEIQESKTCSCATKRLKSVLSNEQHQATEPINCYAYNAAKFDTHFIYRAARRNNIQCEIVGTMGDIKQLSIYDNIVFRDAKQVTGVNGSLQKVAQSMQLNNQKDKLDIGLYIEREQVEQNIEIIKKYCQQDSLVVDSLLYTMRRQLMNVASNFDGDPNCTDAIFLKSMSISSISIKMFAQLGLNDLILKSPSMEKPKVLKAHQDSYSGGLTEALYVGKAKFNLNKKEEQIHCFDFNSLYPSIMQGIELIANMNCFKHEEFLRVQTIENIDQFFDECRLCNPGCINENIFKTKTLLDLDLTKQKNATYPVLNFFPDQGDQDIYYLTNFKFNASLSVGLIGIKMLNQGTLYPLQFDLEEYLKIEDVKKHESQLSGIAVHGFMLRNLLITRQLESFSFKAKCIITSTLHSDKTSDTTQIKPVFRNYIQKIYAERLEAKKQNHTALAEVYKLLMNSLYGKFGQKDFGCSVIMSQNDFQNDQILNNHIFKILASSGELFTNLAQPETIFSRQELMAHIRQKYVQGQLKLEAINSLDRGVAPEYKLSFKNYMRQHTKIGGLIQIASTITAIARLIEGTLMNYTSQMTNSGKQGKCLYGDTDSVFINSTAVEIIQGKEVSKLFPKPLTLFSINQDRMLALKQETKQPIQQMYIFGRKFYAYQSEDKWVFKCKGIQNSTIEQFEDIFFKGRSETQQTRFIKHAGFVETHNRVISNIVRLKQKIYSEEESLNLFCRLRPYESINSYMAEYSNPNNVFKRQVGMWGVYDRTDQDQFLF